MNRLPNATPQPYTADEWLEHAQAQLRSLERLFGEAGWQPGCSLMHGLSIAQSQINEARQCMRSEKPQTLIEQLLSQTPEGQEALRKADEETPSAELERLRDFQRKTEEAEANCCPEDVGFEEWIGILTKRLQDMTEKYQGAALTSSHVADIPAGWKLVPEEPTVEMLAAAGHACDGMDLSKLNTIGKSQMKALKRWDAMLAVAPSAPVTQSATLLPKDCPPRLIAAFIGVDVENEEDARGLWRAILREVSAADRTGNGGQHG